MRYHSFLRLLLAVFLSALYGQTASAQVTQPAYPASATVNYVRTWTAQKPQTDSNALAADIVLNDVTMTTQYIDGIGRPVQSVTRSATPGTGKDIVAPTYYDSCGREVYSYLPYASPGKDGSFKTDPTAEQATFYGSATGVLAGQGETYYYGQTDYEASPLNRVAKTFAPGNSWEGSRGTGTEHAVQQQYLINIPADSVRLWTIAIAAGSLPASSGYYAAGTLYKNVVTDEAGHQAVEYKDGLGRVLLKKVQIAASPGTAHAGWLCTYYIYDDFNNLRFVLQPKAVQLINATWTVTWAIANELCFRYEWDNRHRMTIKKVPGGGEVWMVYDARDRLVMTQDSLLRLNGQWVVTTYDALNRPVKTGRLTDANNRAYHQNLAGSSVSYPGITGSNYSFLTQTWYDNYAWVAGEGSPVNAAFDAAQTGSGFQSASNTVFPYPQAVAAMGITTGMVTGTKVFVLRTSTYLYTSTFYDDRGRVVQVSSTNLTGGKDIVTNQYTFDGKLLVSKAVQNKAGTNAKTYTVVTTNSYDAGGRLLTVQKSVNGGTVSNMAQNSYDELGRLKAKLIGASVETEVYDYNIRGWLLGMNRDYAKAGSSAAYFGFDLGYDKTAVKTTGGTSLGTYSTAQYNGNIEGTVWKSLGDGEMRKYDYGYDNANRLLAADFNQYTGSAFNKTAGVDFSVSSLAYDANGNILSMKQAGLKAGASATIDSLTYTYMTNSNKLQAVVDGKNDNASPLGDFKYDPAGKTATDYTYDGNGNLSTDANKKISPIDYNFLNLPAVVTVTGKGNIAYTYDAVGNKLQKVVTDNTVSPARVTTTLYMGGAVYQNDTLQFIATEEGRARIKSDGTFTYDYFLRDHLGNVRMVLTEEARTDIYPTLSWEGTGSTDPVVTNQDAVWGNASGQAVGVTANRMDKSGVPGQPFGTNNGTYVRQLKKSTGSFGGGMLLKVMSGDVVNTSVDYYYNTTSADNHTANGLNTLVTSLLAAITGSPAVSAAAKAGASTATTSMAAANSTMDIFLNGEDPSSTANQPPEAYLHVLLFNEQFVFDNVNSYVQKVGTANAVTNIAKSVPVKKNGYAYIYFSNESESFVWFDNLQLNHQRGRILEETHYYPFGLQMAGISSSAAGSMDNRKEFNGIEHTTDLGLNQYDAFYRTYDPQTGRFLQIDPKIESAEAWSPYSAMLDNPIRFSDPLGDSSRPTLVTPPSNAPSKDNTTLNNKRMEHPFVPTTTTTSDPAITVTVSKGKQFALEVGDVGVEINGGSKDIIRASDVSPGGEQIDPSETKQAIGIQAGIVGGSRELTETTQAGTITNMGVTIPTTTIVQQRTDAVSVGINGTPFSVGVEQTTTATQTGLSPANVQAGSGQITVGASKMASGSHQSAGGTKFSVGAYYKVEIKINFLQLLSNMFR